MHLHILGICGTFMAGVAAIARAAGHRVTGADTGAYPPMSEQLAALGIDIVEGYEAGQLDLAPDMVVVGNVATRGMPVVEAMLNRRVPYQSGPQWLAENVLDGRRVIAVSGTHGKTTTSAMLAWILEQAGMEPGFLIGGVARDFPVSARPGGGDVFVIEADEYDTAFFDKRAKFLLYGPDTVIVNNLEFDHADIYTDLAAIRWQFHQLIRALPGNGRLIVRAGDANIQELLAMGCWTPVERFASRRDAGAEWTAEVAAGGMLRLRHAGAAAATAWSMNGAHNAENAAAAVAAAAHVGVDPEQAVEALGRFEGVRRRLELRGVFGGVSLYDDFAHHPTAIRRSIEALRDARGNHGGRLLVVLEPRSNTMKMGIHRDTLAGALGGADRVWVRRPEGLGWDPAEALRQPHGRCFDSVAEIVDEVAADAKPGDDVVVMSNGGFGGIHVLLERALADSASRG